MSRVYNNAVATISSGQSLSAAVAVGAGVVTAIIMPSSWTAANLTFKASIDGVTYYDLYDAYNVEVTVQTAASRYVSVEGINFSGVSYLQLRSGTSGVPVAQAADRVLQVIGRKERAKA